DLDSATAARTAPHAIAMTERMMTTRKVLVSCGDELFMSTSENFASCHYSRAFSRASRPGRPFAGPGSAGAAACLDPGYAPARMALECAPASQNGTTCVAPSPFGARLAAQMIFTNQLEMQRCPETPANGVPRLHKMRREGIEPPILLLGFSAARPPKSARSTARQM